jgi:ABC-type Fe3+/spermidine/putrescine transport system ATPase subunit
LPSSQITNLKSQITNHKSFLSLDHLEKTFGSLRVTADLSLSVSEGEILALLGPSGSGKTTVLRLVAGFETLDSGRIVVEEEDVTRTPPERRRFGMVFQHYALFPHMTVAENAAFGLEAQGMAKAEAAARVAETLAVVDLSGFQERRVTQLSGGQQQRVALARALAPRPRVLLLDEPLSNLDPTLRERTRRELARVIRRVGITTVFVTHEQEEAFDLADRVAVIHRGGLQQVGSPEELYERPATRFVASFIGRSNSLPATWDAATNAAVLPTGQRWPGVPGDPVSGGEPVDLLVRPESLVFADAGAAGSVPGTVVARRYGGRASLFIIALEGLPEVEVSADSRAARVQERVTVAPSPEGPMPRVYSKEKQ